MLLKKEEIIFLESESLKKLGKIFRFKILLGNYLRYNGTVYAMKAMGIKQGDEVITQSFTFVATVEAILLLGAKPVISNIDDSLNIVQKT